MKGFVITLHTGGAMIKVTMYRSAYKNLEGVFCLNVIHTNNEEIDYSCESFKTLIMICRNIISVSESQGTKVSFSFERPHSHEWNHSNKRMANCESLSKETISKFLDELELYQTNLDT